MKITLKQQIWFSPKASKRLKSLEPVFKELLLVHQDYIDGEQNLDCPYWYSERPHTGLLAAAVWRYGGTALEEYGTNKTKERKSKRGRCDLYIRINKKTAFECEAKRLWLNLGGKAEVPCQKVKDWLNWAVGDVKKLQSRKGLALCFVTPVMHKSRIPALDRRYFCECINLLNSTPEHDALVWIGITKGQKPISGKFKYPGLLLVVKEVR